MVRLVNKSDSLLGVYLDEKIEDLSEMREEDVFLKLLQSKDIPEEQRQELLEAFREIITAEDEEEAV